MADNPSEGVTVEIVDGVAVITIDDGKANALGFEAIAAVNNALDQAESDASAVMLTGREGKFSAGFDLGVMTGDDIEAIKSLLNEGGKLCHRLYLHPQPVVAACTGHALALGAIMLMSCDMRMGVDGPFKIGTTEVTIGMPLPRFAVELARARLSPRHFQIATQHGPAYDPSGAVDAGFLDQLVPPDKLYSTALEYSSQVAGTVHHAPFVATRRYVRAVSAEAVLAGLHADIADFSISS